MIRIYRDRSKFKEENILLDNEAFFNNNVSPKNLNKASLRIMKDIDKADLIDSNIGTIQTPYGITGKLCKKSKIQDKNGKLHVLCNSALNETT